MIPAWADRYVGIPWREGGRRLDGADCVGLCLMVLRRFGVRPPANLCGGQPVRFEDRQPGDVLAFRLGRYAIHVGVALDRRRMLHSQRRTGSVLEHYTGRAWERRIEGVYRYG